MKIKRVISQIRNDFSAEMVCEHCGHNQYIKSGYDDHFYHHKVIPAMTCNSCGKNRAGDVPATPNNKGLAHVSA